MMPCSLAAICRCLVIVATFFYRINSKTVTSVLHAEWNQTPLVLEASEFLSDHASDNVFWRYVNEVGSKDVKNSSDKDTYEHIIRIASNIVGSLDQIDYLKLSLSLRIYSPKIQMHLQVVNEIDDLKNCESFFDIHGSRMCSLDMFEQLLVDAIVREPPQIYIHDHVFPKSSVDFPVVILYGEIGTQSFTKFHNYLSELSLKGKLRYVLRHFYHNNQRAERVQLSGYGVELDLKSTEYKAVDDSNVASTKPDEQSNDEDLEVSGILFSQLKSKRPDLNSQLNLFKEHLIENASELSPLKIWQLQDMSFQAAQKIYDSDRNESLQTLISISQNFPMIARSLARVNVNASFRAAMERLQFNRRRHFETLQGGLFINGIEKDAQTIDAYQLNEIFTKESHILEAFSDLGISKMEDILEILEVKVKRSQEFGLDIRSDSISWLNNVETDSRYSGWSRQLKDLLRPTYPGVLRKIKRNFNFIVLIVDPTVNIEHTALVLDMLWSLYTNNVPVRIGLLLVTNDGDQSADTSDVPTLLYRAFHYVKENDDLETAFKFIVDLFQVTAKAASSISLNTIESQLDSVKSEFSELRYDAGRRECALFYQRSGLTSLPQILVNGKPISSKYLSNNDQLEQVLLSELYQSTNSWLKWIYYEEIDEKTDLLAHLMSQPNIVPTMNRAMLDGTREYVRLSADRGVPLSNEALRSNSRGTLMSTVLSQLGFIAKHGDPQNKTVTIVVIADLDSVAGRSFARKAFMHMKSSSNARLSFLHSGAPSNRGSVSSLIKSVLVTQESTQARLSIQKLLKEEYVNEYKDNLFELLPTQVNVDKIHSTLEDRSWLDEIYWQGSFCAEHLGVSEGKFGVFVNGWYNGPFDDESAMSTVDFELMEKVSLECALNIQTLVTANLKKYGFSNVADATLKLCSVLQRFGNPHERVNFNDLSSDDVGIIVIPPRNPARLSHQVTIMLDPLSRVAQKVAPMLLKFSEVLNIEVSLFLDPKDKWSEMPLKSFYKYVMNSEIQFNEDDGSIKAPVAEFNALPTKVLMTMNLHSPESWMVSVVDTPVDLDNILLRDIQGNVTAVYGLDYIVLEGHCYDTSTGSPPRGLQFTLGTRLNPFIYDTIVMANLGYFQLKAKPGTWVLQLRKGRSHDIYTIENHVNTDSQPDSAEPIVVIASFNPKVIQVYVQKKLDMEDEKLLKEEPEESGGLWGSIKSTLFNGSSGKTEERSKSDVINVFSLASGHLYERFMRIMVVSTLRNTKSPVKFWFLKNFLSPSFMQSIHVMAETYNFTYEFVQYKWPHWLQSQSEKQRTIWGYKILFLDVLFPLDLKKIIFVDADAIVRADLAELRDLPLNGNSYGYTPFCDSQDNMDNFMFWKKGYWRSHLGHRKYHISALYVVDLVQFRHIAAGDRLRGQYQGLSQDPNSLANLDQDLPNNMIHQVGIMSLPQEWLWCETWCSEAEKKSAKVIDLCNNPKTKEPKLNRAVRIVEEWSDYDNEIKLVLDSNRKNSERVPVSHLSDMNRESELHKEL